MLREQCDKAFKQTCKGRVHSRAAEFKNTPEGHVFTLTTKQAEFFLPFLTSCPHTISH